MGKKQHSVSIPLEFWEWIEKFYHNNEVSFRSLGIDSPSELLRVLANLGKPNVEKLLSEFVALSQTGARASPQAAEQLRKLRNQTEHSSPLV